MNYLIINICLVSLCISFILIYILKKKFKKFPFTKFSEEFKKYIDVNYKFIIVVLFLLTLFTSIYKLDKLPYGMHVDEAGMSYDAISLANYGIDRYQKHFPVYLINYGNGQSVMYAYLVAFLIKIFGYSIIIVRTPAVLFRIIMFISILFIMRKENKYQTIIFLGLYTICPYFIMASRFGLDCNLLVGFFTLSICLLLKAIKSKSNWLYFISGIFIGLTLYTYALSYFIVPLFLFLTCIYLLYIKEIRFIQLLIFGIPIFILALPLMLTILVNTGHLNEIKSFITIPNLGFYRGGEISFQNIPKNLYMLKTIFSIDNKEIFGDQLLYNSSISFGTAYYISIPFFILGFIACFKNICLSIKNRKYNLNVIFMIWFLSVFICQFLIDIPNINKANAIYIPILYFTSFGITIIIKSIKQFAFPIVIIFMVNFILFFGYYFYKYNNETQNLYWFPTNYLDALKYSQTLNSQKIYISDNLTVEPYIYVLLYNNISPYDFAKNDIEVKNNDKQTTYSIIQLDLNNIDLSSIYITYNEESICSSFESNGFTCETFGNMLVWQHN